MNQLKKGAKTFPPLVGFVGAAEFACNDKIRESYGSALGIAASAFSGALFLTPADHFMVRETVFKQGFREAFQFLRSQNAFFTGYLSIVLRETIFMTNLIYVGPMTGSILKKISGNKEEEGLDKTWNFIGRAVSGTIASFISHPFDVASREQQVIFGKTGKKVSLLRALADLHRTHMAKKFDSPLEFFKTYPWFKGGAYRMWLGSFGGAVLGGSYEYFTQQY
jgi:hypothetical protein